MTLLQLRTDHVAYTARSLSSRSSCCYGDEKRLFLLRSIAISPSTATPPCFHRSRQRCVYMACTSNYMCHIKFEFFILHSGGDVDSCDGNVNSRGDEARAP